MNSNLLTINDLCEELAIGKNTAYELIRTGKIPSGKIGSRIMIHRTALEHYIDTQTNSLPSNDSSHDSNMLSERTCANDLL